MESRGQQPLVYTQMKQPNQMETTAKKKRNDTTQLGSTPRLDNTPDDLKRGQDDANTADTALEIFLSDILPYYTLIIEILESNEQMKKTMSGIKTQAVLAVVGTGIGGIVGGPGGALVGTIVGGALGYVVVDDYKSMITVIKNLTDADKTQLVKKVQERIEDASLEALTSYIELPGQRKLLLQCIQSVVQK